MISSTHSDSEKVTNVKSLGIFIDENLRWQTHIDKLSEKIASGIGAVKRIRDFVPAPTLHCIYNALSQSQFDYCNIVWGNCGKTLFDRLQKLHNRGARVLERLEHSVSNTKSRNGLQVFK